MLQIIHLPELGESITEATILKIRVAVGQKISVDETLLDYATDKVDGELPADFDGTVAEIFVANDQVMPIGAKLLAIETEAVVETAIEKPSIPPIVDPPALPSATQVLETEKPPAPLAPTVVVAGFSAKKASPVAKKVVKDFALNLDEVIHSVSEDRRITKKDVEGFIKKRLSAPMPVSSPPTVHLPDFSTFGPVRREKMSGIAKATAKNMQAAWSNVPHAWLMEKADLTALETFRGMHKEAVKQAGGSLTVTVIVAKAVAGLLRKFPRANASVDMAAQEIIFKNYVNIGIAVDTEHGLFVPVIRDCDRKSMAEIGAELLRFSALAREKKLPLENQEGGTFTITNVGGFGGTGILPIVNTPEAAILGLTAAQVEMVWNPEKQAAEPRPLMQMTLGFDHRLVNGAEATRFLRQLKTVLEMPELMLIV